MGSGVSSLFSKSTSSTSHCTVVTHPEDADKPGLLYPGKESFVSDEFTRWSVNMAMEVVYEKFEELDNGDLRERTYLAVVQPLDQALDSWNGVVICPTKKYIKAFIIDYDPSKKDSQCENLTIYSYLVQEQYEGKVSDWLKQEIEKIHQ